MTDHPERAGPASPAGWAPLPMSTERNLRLRRGALAELALLFLKLGTVSFGGPAAHIALMEEETVARRKWFPRAQFLDMIAATNLIPGPNAAEMAIWIGYLRARWSGLLVAGLAFILPGALLSSLLAWAYSRYGALPELRHVLGYGVHPAVLVIILAAAVRLGRSALAQWWWGLWTGAGFALALLGVDPVWVLLGAGTLAVLRRALVRIPPALFALGALIGEGLFPTPTAGAVGLFFLRVGALLFGSGMMLFAFIEREIVGRGWLTAGQLTDAIAAGQVTPGPVLSSATFIGWLLAGPGGAALATGAVFLPAFLIVAFLGPLLPRLQKRRGAREFLNGVSAAVVGVILAVTVRLALGVPWDVGTALLLATSAGLVFLAKWPAWSVVILGLAVGGLRYLAG